MINVDVSVKNIINVKKSYGWNSATCSCKDGKQLASIIDNNSLITCYEVIEDTNIVPTSFNGKKQQPVKHKIRIFYLHFYELL